MNCYIYYRVEVIKRAKLLAEIQQLSEKLLDVGLPQPTLFCKKRSANNTVSDLHQTWMEIYSNVDDEFLSTLANLIVTSNLPVLSACERHVECFEAISLNSDR